jgi:hypothetical protein
MWGIVALPILGKNAQRAKKAKLPSPLGGETL